jgi:hypothetical protein
MAHKDIPRVKLPDHVARKPVVPGPNSWAQAQQQQPITNNQTSSVQVTNKDKYEDKPMPPPPAHEASPPPHITQPKTYIQPAIPLINPVSNTNNPKNRAVTDPVAPKPLFAGRKASVTHLRKKFSNPKPAMETPQDEARKASDPRMAVHLSPGKAAQLLGLFPTQNNNGKTPRASAPTSSLPDPFRISYEDHQERPNTPARQLQSAPVPTRRYLQENGLQTPTLVEPSDASQQVDAPETQSHGQASNAIDQASVNGMLRPPKVGAFGNVGDIGVVEENGMHRMESFRGIIENAGPAECYGDHTNTTSSKAPWQSGTERGQDTGNSLTSSAYTPDSYGGVWENDPAVVSRPETRP